jgi:hypothetical protein
MGARVVAVRGGHRGQRVAAGTPGRGRLQRGAELARPTRGQAPPQVCQPTDVRVQGRRPHAEPGRQPRERDRLQALGVGQRRRRVHDGLRTEPGAWHQAAFAIAASIAAPGSRTAGPWPTTSSGGSSARSARADSIAVPLSQVAIAANGKRAYRKVGIATRP